MSKSVSVEGIDEINRILKQMGKTLNKDVKSALITGAGLVKTEAQRSISRKSIGKEVTRTRNEKEYSHIASAPGDAPNTDTGRLINSIQVEPSATGVSVGTEVEYARSLEFGSSETNLKARPFMFPAFHAKKNDVRKLLVQAAKKAIARVGK